jgi:ABC-2 type transport system permease protein
MSVRRTFATALRVLRQLRHDHRTIALMLFMPSVLLIVLRFVFQGNKLLFDGIAPLLLGILPFVLRFIVASIAVLRERSSGTLERLLVSPASKTDIIFGYALAFAVAALAQATLASIVVVDLLDVTIAGGTPILLLCAIVAGVLGMAFGLLFSSFARNEFQAVQFMPAFVLPQFLTCGLFVPRGQMNQALQYFSDCMPITYVVDALKQVQFFTTWTTDLTADLLLLVGFTVFALLLGAASLKSNNQG